MNGHAYGLASFALRWHHDRSTWAFIGLRFIPALVAFNLVWETAHLPLYTLWEEGTARSIAFAVFHCTLGDMLIGVFALLGALVVTGAGHLCKWRWLRVSALTVLFGVGYTAFSEWIHTSVTQSWEYSSQMPIVPVVKLGLSPLLQWIAVPIAAIWLAHRSNLWPRRKCRDTQGSVTSASADASSLAKSCSDIGFMNKRKKKNDTD